MYTVAVRAWRLITISPVTSVLSMAQFLKLPKTTKKEKRKEISLDKL